MNEIPSVEESYGTELIRKTIHLSSLAIPVIYYYVSQTFALSVLIPLALAFGISDLARILHPGARSLYERFFGFLLRRHERSASRPRLNGATFVLLSAIVCVWLFPKVVVITAFAILIVSDSAAALFGRKFGRHRFMTKSVEGSSAFLVTALMVVALSPKIEYLPAEYAIGAFGALVGTVVEALSTDWVDDNLSIPLTIGVTMWVLYAWLLPELNVFALDLLH
jgi:dolichol kinase